MKKLMISLSVAVFGLAMMANIQYAMDGYGVDNSNLHAQVLAQSTGTGGTTDGGGSGTGTGIVDWYNNTDFYAHMEIIEIYNHNVNLKVGYKVFTLEIGNYQADFVGYLKYCKACNTFYHTCDMTKEGFYSVPAGNSTN